MKKFSYLMIIVLISSLVLAGCSLLSNISQVPATNQSLISRNGPSYDDVVLNGGFQAGNFPEVWDLTTCDMTIGFTYDANGLVDDAGAHAWAELGIRQFGSGNFNPSAGSGVWLATDYDWAVNTFDPDVSPILDLDDKLMLQKVGGHGEGDYNLPSTPPAPGSNHRFWWDRDGVDPYQNDETANTGGIYNVVIKLTAISATSGTAYMTINGLDQGFETDGDWNTIEITPAGMTFTGDMTKMQVFYGLWGYGATHSVSFNNISVSGCLRTIVINGCDTGVVDVVYDGELVSENIENIYSEAKNHGQFVRGVAMLTNDLMKAGIITGKEKGEIQKCAAQTK